MNPHYRLKLLTHYPEWHNKPFHLSTAEMENPYSVLEGFFEIYRLPQIRASLKLWLDDAIRYEEADASKHVVTCDHLKKLVEAGWLLYRQWDQNKANATVEEETGGQSYEEEEERKINKGFARQGRLLYQSKSDPVQSIHRVFQTMDIESLLKTISRWQRIALCSDDHYREAGQRADLLRFCDGLCRLAEAAFALDRIAGWEQESGIALHAPVNLQYRLLSGEFDFRLGAEELEHPQQVLKDFFSVFPLYYTRAGLWDLLDSAVSCTDANFDKTDLLTAYECFRVLTESTWLIQKDMQQDRLNSDA